MNLPTTAGQKGSGRNRFFARALLFGALLSVLCGFAASPSAFAQGCAMCYTSAVGAGPAARAIDYGIIALLLPALLLFIAVFVLLIRRAAAAAARESQETILQELPSADPFPLT